LENALRKANSHDDDFNLLKKEFETFTLGRFEDDVSMISIKLI
jgi:hypothetical protein